MILDQRNILAEAIPMRLDCTLCARNESEAQWRGEPSRRQMLGCGERPLHARTLEPVDVVSMLEQGASLTELCNGYTNANLGGVVETLGWAWPHCPRWYLEFSPVGERVRAAGIIRRLRWVEAGAIPYESLTPTEAHLMDMAAYLRQEIDRRDREVGR